MFDTGHRFCSCKYTLYEVNHHRVGSVESMVDITPRTSLLNLDVLLSQHPASDILKGSSQLSLSYFSTHPVSHVPFLLM